MDDFKLNYNGKKDNPDGEKTLMEKVIVEVANGKYKVILEEGSINALRYDKPWRDCCGDNLIYNLAIELDNIRNKKLKVTLSDEDTKLMLNGKMVAFIDENHTDLGTSYIYYYAGKESKPFKTKPEAVEAMLSEFGLTREDLG